jgi:hypothetical protein
MIELANAVAKDHEQVVWRRDASLGHISPTFARKSLTLSRIHASIIRPRIPPLVPPTDLSPQGQALSAVL